MLPIELMARSVSYYIAIAKGSYPSCERFVEPIYLNEIKAEQLCAKYSMKSPIDIKFYINATWYGENSEDYQNFKDVTGFSDEQIAEFFDTDHENSFGSIIAQ